MKWSIVFIFHVLVQFTCLAHNENCSNCQLDFTCCQGLCHPCFNCQLHMRQGGSCVCSLNDCGDCLKGYEEVSKTKFSSILKACRVARTTGNGTNECTSDESCPKDKYCFNSKCVSCFDCLLYHRQPSRLPCAKYPSDCGYCIEGYFEPPITHYSKLKSCSHKADYIRYKALPEQNFLYVLIIFIVGSGIFAVFFLRRNKKETSRLNISQVEGSISLAPESPSFSCEEEVVFTYIREEGEKSNATAYAGSSESANLPSFDDEVLNTSNSPINYDDEETIPSSWTPNPSVETRDPINECSFSGIINRIRETKLTEYNGECVEMSDNAMCHPESNVQMGEIETAMQDVHVEEDTAKT